MVKKELNHYWLLRSYFQSMHSEIDACEIMLERYKETEKFPSAIPFALRGVEANLGTCLQACRYIQSGEEKKK